MLAKREDEFIVDGIAIAPEYRKYKLGKTLLDRGIEETLRLGGKRIFLVARAPGFFRKQGFVTVPGRMLPISSNVSLVLSMGSAVIRK